MPKPEVTAVVAVVVAGVWVLYKKGEERGGGSGGVVKVML